MMKSKRKAAPSSPLSRFWREFLFTREFEFETAASSEECVAALQRIPETAQMTEGNTHRRQVSFQASSSKTIAFQIDDQKRTRRSAKFTTIAVAHGTITAVGEGISTVVTGEAQFSPVRLLGLLMVGIAAGLFFASGFRNLSHSGSQVFAVMIAIIWAMSLLRDWSTALRERNQLIGAIEGLVTLAERNAHLQQRDSLQSVGKWSDGLSAQKAKR